MTVLMPFDFLKLVWAAFLGIIFFAEVPDFLTWVGAAIVFGSSLLHRLARVEAAQGQDRQPRPRRIGRLAASGALPAGAISL